MGLIQDKKGRQLTGLMFDERKDEVMGDNSSEKIRKENCSIVVFPGKKKKEEMINANEEDNEVEVIGQTIEEGHVDIQDEFLGSFMDATRVKEKEDVGEYLGHTQPKEGTGRGVAESVLDHLNNYKADISNLKIVLTDGTSKMTGVNNGAAATLEQTLQRPLQRAVCLNHHIEKPFEHLFELLDGKTLSNTTYSGEIGKQIQKDNLHLKPIVKFKPVHNENLL